MRVQKFWFSLWKELSHEILIIHQLINDFLQQSANPN